MPKCEHCGSHVSATWKRVFGTERCQTCAPKKGAGTLAAGGAEKPGVDVEHEWSRSDVDSRGCQYPL